MAGFLGPVLYVLVPLNFVLYIMLVRGYLRDKRFFEIPKVATPAEAFALFERSYKQLFPQERDGFTWGEAVKKANSLTKISDFQSFGIQKSLEQYEAYRYGKIGQESQIDVGPILKLVSLLRKKIYTS